MKAKIDAGTLVLLALLGSSASLVGCDSLFTDEEALKKIGVRTTTFTPGGGSEPVARSAHPELRFEVTLDHAPVGSTLDLRCDWTGPSHDVRHQNHWQTKEIDKDLWPTHCRHTIGPEDPAGDWSVTMKLGERTLATRHFSVQ